MGTKETIHDIEKKLIDGLNEVKKKLLKFKRDMDSPFIVSKDGKVVEVDAETMDKKDKKDKNPEEKD